MSPPERSGQDKKFPVAPFPVLSSHQGIEESGAKVIEMGFSVEGALVLEIR